MCVKGDDNAGVYYREDVVGTVIERMWQGRCGETVRVLGRVWPTWEGE